MLYVCLFVAEVAVSIRPFDLYVCSDLSDRNKGAEALDIEVSYRTPSAGGNECRYGHFKCYRNM